MMPTFWKMVRKRTPNQGNTMTAELSCIYDHWIVYPDDDHVIEFYPYLAEVKDPTDLPFGLSEYGFGKRMKSLYSGEETVGDLRKADQAISRKEMLKEYAENLKKVTLPEEPENSIRGEGTARLIANIASGRRAVHICNIPNNGAVSNLPDEAVLEVEAVTDSAGVRPLWAGEAPLPLEALLRKRIAWQEMVVDAAVKGDRKLALQAMQIDECAIPPKMADEMLKELFANNKGMVPTFEKKSR